MNLKGKIGDFGQGLAREYLVKKGYEILGENFYTREGEIDIIAAKEGQLIMVEVKTRLSARYGAPEESVSPSKIKKMQQAALEFLQQRQINHDNYRFDIIAVEIDKFNKKAVIRHHKSIE